MFLEPIREPGTRLATEYYGGKARRFWSFEKVVLEEITIFRPRMCPHCKQEAVIFDEREFPHCPSCGSEPFISQPRRRPSSEIERYKRLKAQKRGRIIYK
jgi:ribosomal protein S27E